jgi:hypothetical protein
MQKKGTPNLLQMSANVSWLPMTHWTRAPNVLEVISYQYVAKAMILFCDQYNDPLLRLRVYFYKSIIRQNQVQIAQKNFGIMILLANQPGEKLIGFDIHKLPHRHDVDVFPAPLIPK